LRVNFDNCGAQDIPNPSPKQFEEAMSYCWLPSSLHTYSSNAYISM